MPRSLIVLILFLVGLSSSAQSPAFEHLTVGDGLSHNTVYAMIQDKDGLFWIGTRFGLNRYDGYDFQIFTPGDEAGSINGPQVLCLLEDGEDRIWAGHRDKGISIYDKRTGSFMPLSLGEGGTYPVDWSTITVRALFRDSRDFIWIGTFGGGVVVVNENNELIHHFSTYSESGFTGGMSSDFVFDFAEDDEGHIYIATSGKGLNRINYQDQRIEVLHSSDDADLNSFDKALYYSSEGDVWIATSGNGLYRYTTSENHWQHYNAPDQISHPIVTDIAEDREGNLWLTTDGGGLNRLSPTTGEHTAYNYSAMRASSLNTDALYQLLFDRADNLLVGSFNGGLNVHRAVQPPFVTERNYDQERAQGLRSVLCVAQDEEGTTWLGTDGDGLFSFADKLTDFKALRARPTVQGVRTRAAPEACQRVPGEVIDDVITALSPGKNDGLWYGSFAAGLGYYDKARETVVKFRHQEDQPQSLGHDNVWDLEIALDGGLWIGLLGGGLDYLAPGSCVFKHFIPENGNEQSLSGRQVIDILLDRNGRYLWIATENAGLNRLDLNSGTIQRYQHEPDNIESISSNHLRHLFQGENGSLWIGTENDGLNVLAPGEETFTHYGKANGYPFEMVSGITVDADGYAWITGLKNIFRWNLSEDSVIEIPPEKELGYNLYNPGAIQRLTSGRLILGGVNGFSVVDPALVRPTIAAPQVLISELQLANRTVTPGQLNGREVISGDLNSGNTAVRLSYQDRGIAFYFAAPAYPSPREVRYAYQLEGFDADWNYLPSGERVAYFSSLKGGNYKLHIKATGANGVWGEAAPPLSVIVQPPFWQTRWFIIGTILACLLSVYLLNRILLRRQRERYQQEALAREGEILSLKNKTLKEEVATKQSELGASLLEMAHKNKFLNDLKNKIKLLNEKEGNAPAKSLRSVIRLIDHELAQENYWEQFQLIFDQGYQNFVSRLREVHPKLSVNDSRLCCFIRMELNNREIASVLNITLNGVEQAKYRLKKKMELDKAVNLNDYVREYG